MPEVTFHEHDPRCPTCDNGNTIVGEHFVTAEMASDAGMPEMAGEHYGYEYGECTCGPVASLKLTEGEVREGLIRLRNIHFFCSECKVGSRVLAGQYATCRTQHGVDHIALREIVYDGSFEIDWLAADPGCPKCQGSGMQYDEISDTFQQGTCIARCRRYDLTGIDRMVLDYDLCEWSKGMDCSYECSICERIAAARDAAEAAGLEVIDA